MIGLGAYLACQAYFWKGSVGYEGRLYNGGGVDAEVGVVLLLTFLFVISRGY